MTNHTIAYSAITTLNGTYCHNCDEWGWECPECGAHLCVTCMDGCDACERDIVWSA